MSDADFFMDRVDQEWLRDVLGKIPALIEDLSVTLTRQARVQRGQLGKPPKGKRDGSLPLHLGAADVATRLHNCLATWVRTVCEQRAIDYDGTADIAGLARWLRANLIPLALTEGSGEAADDIAGHVDACRRMIDLPPEDEIIIDEQRLAAANRQVLTAGQIERVAVKLGAWGEGLTKRRVETLVKAKKIKPAAVDGPTSFYQLGEVLDAHRRHARNPGTPRSQA